MDAVMWLRTQWDRALGIALIVAGGVVLLLGWIGVSGSEYLAEQLAYITSGGLGGLFLLGVGCTLLVVATLGDEWRKLDRLEQVILDAAESPTEASSSLDDALSSASETMKERRSAERSTQKVAAAGSVGVMLSAGVLAYAWYVASGTGDAQVGIDAVGVGAAGLAAQFVAVSALVVPGRRALSRRLSDVLGPIAIGLELTKKSKPRTSAMMTRGESRVAVVDGLTLYHRPDCVATVGQRTKLVSVENAALGRRPCLLCKAP